MRYKNKKAIIILPLSGALTGYFILHPISMAIMDNELSLNIIKHAFSLAHFKMTFYFSMLGLFFGVVVALLQTKLIKQKAKMFDQNILLEQNVEEKDALLRILSHDLTNLIGSSKELLNMVIEAPETFSDLELAEINTLVVHSISEALRLVEVSKVLIAVESGKIDMVRVEYNLCDLIKEIGAGLHPMSKQKKLKIKYNIPDLPIMSKVEPMVFKHTIVGNLLSNAIKFSEEEECISITVEKESENAVIKIINTGPGIADDRLKTIFSSSMKTTTLGTSGEKGTGLGLPLAYKFVRLMNGTIFAESIPIPNHKSNHITTFTIVLLSTGHKIKE